MGYFNDKCSYYGLKRGDFCKTLDTLWDSDCRIPAGTYFIVESFPPYVMTRKGRKHQHFVFGVAITQDVRFTHVRCELSQCKKI